MRNKVYGYHYDPDKLRVYFCRYHVGVMLHRDMVLFAADTLGM